MNKTILFLFIGFLSFSTGCRTINVQNSSDKKLDNFFKKENVKILVTDSGLGGISVAADVVKRIKKSGVFKNVDVIFFNAQPHADSGYNSMDTPEQKVEVFNNALNAIEKHFKPDLLLIACNTLSVLYDYTEFSKIAEFPVVGIVGTGVDLIKQKLDENPNSKVLLFATKTTVNQAKHKEGLIKLGIPEENIIGQACPKLAGHIERGPDSDSTKSLVTTYVDEVLKNIKPNDSSLFVSYNCTHYGYIDNVFQSVFAERAIKVKEFLDPNPLMADFIFTEKYLRRYENTNVTVRVVSQPKLSSKELGAIFGLIKPVSAETADAIMEYKFTPNYFEWKSIVNSGN